MLATPGNRAGIALVGVLMSTSLAMLVMERVNPEAVATLRARTNEILLPVVETLASPMDALAYTSDWVAEMVTLRSENLALKAANAELLQWQGEAQRLQLENHELRLLLNVVPPGSTHYIAAKLVGDHVSNYMESALISAGTQDGVEKHQAVVSMDGFVGRVIEAGNTSARVLLLTDGNSRVPVVGERSRENAIVSGKGKGGLGLDYVSPHTTFSVGERLVTSGDGGLFPPGIPVGRIVSINDTKILAAPLADTSRIEYVTVLQYKF